MKIVIYSGTFKKDQDGVARTLYELVDSLLDRGFEVSVWSPLISDIEREGLTINKLPSLPLFIYNDYRFSLVFHRIKKDIKKFDPDIIHISTPDYIGYRLMKWGKRHHIPVVSVYHTDFPSYLSYYHLGLFSNIGWRYLKRFYNQSDSVLVPTSELKKRLKEKNINNTWIWGRGIDTDKFKPENRSRSLREGWNVNDEKLITYVGRFVWYKDLDVFIDVYRRFSRSSEKGVKFLLIGSGPIIDELKESMPDAIFTGYLKGDELTRGFASGDIFLFPSTTETFGNVVQEALASGLPAIVSNVGGCQEIVNISNGGEICEAGSGEDFYRACRDLVRNDKKYNRYRDNGIDYSKKVSWMEINSRLIDHYISMTK